MLFFNPKFLYVEDPLNWYYTHLQFFKTFLIQISTYLLFCELSKLFQFMKLQIFQMAKLIVLPNLNFTIH